MSTLNVTIDRAVWTTSYINDLPDSAFLHIEPGGSKDSEGKTTPRSLRHFPVRDAAGNVDMPHLRNALSRIPQSSLSDAVKAQCTAKARRMLGNQRDDAPRENLVRGIFPSDLELRYSGEEEGMPSLFGHFSVFNQWTEINSAWEGEFMERIAPTAYDKTFAENRSNMKVLFNHGKDPTIGSKPLGPINDLGVDSIGAYYDVSLLDTAYNRELLPGLEAGLYGASFRFKAMRDEWNSNPEPSEQNPQGLRERTITEAKVMEFGPVTFGAYEGATAGVRSLTDDYIITSLFGDNAERTKELLTAPSEETPADATSPEPERRAPHHSYNSRRDWNRWLNSQSSTL